jgi:hypothetical protein
MKGEDRIGRSTGHLPFFAGVISFSFFLKEADVPGRGLSFRGSVPPTNDGAKDGRHVLHYPY